MWSGGCCLHPCLGVDALLLSNYKLIANLLNVEAL